MNDTSHVVPQIFSNDVVPILLIILALVSLLLINREKLKNTWKIFKTRHCLNHLGLEQISNIKCPNGMGQYFTIDRLLLRHGGISLLVYKKYPGKIFCADHIDEWTQMLGQKSYNFKNPLFELDYQIKAIKRYIPNVEIDGYLFFDHSADFPKGHPDRVIHPQNIPQQLQRNHRHNIDTQVMEAWKKFKKMALNE